MKTILTLLNSIKLSAKKEPAVIQRPFIEDNGRMRKTAYHTRLHFESILK